jgi:hypothetical protein
VPDHQRADADGTQQDGAEKVPDLGSLL